MRCDQTRKIGLTRNWRHDQRGGVAIIFGLLLLPMIGAIALAIDFGNVMTMRTKAQMAADAAALQAAGVARDLIKSGAGDPATNALALANAKTRAEALFKAHADQSGLKGYTVDVTVTKSGQDIVSKASFTVTNPNFLSKVFGHSTFKASGSAGSAASLPTYVDVYVLMDVSQSMGLAATTADMTKLFNLTKAQTPEGCTFGCHTRKSNYPSNTLSNEKIAQNNNVRLRVDVMRDAVVKMINDAQTNALGDSTYRFGLYTMSLNSAKSNFALNEIAAISGNYTTLKVAAQNIDLSSNNDGGGIGDSYINEQLSALDAKVPNSGDGSSQDKAKVYVFLVTDGVRDVKGSCTSGHCVAPMDKTYCDPFKTTTAKITVGVLYTTYLPIYKENNPANGFDNDYNNLVKPIAANIAPALKNCASQDWYFEASDEAGMNKAFAKMFAQTTQAPALTN